MHDHWRLWIKAAQRNGDRRSLWHKVTSAKWKPDGWATEAAALAARLQFKHWVDYEMNSQQRLAQAGSAAARSSASLGALQRPPDPTRVSSRKQPRNAHAIASLHVIDGKVQLGLASLGARPALTAVHTVMVSQTRLQMLSDSSKSTRVIVVQRRLTKSSVMSRLACYCVYSFRQMLEACRNTVQNGI